MIKQVWLWGFNPISNGGNQPDQWRTLASDEWDYVFNTRSTASGIRYAKAQINNVNGVILLPDNWNSSVFNLSNTNNSSVSFNCNVITSSAWNILEQAGAVFLPAAGCRWGTSVNTSAVGGYGFYWSASCNQSASSGYAYGLYFRDSALTPQGNNHCAEGLSVRLVVPVEN